jgi:hypothetical protein
MIKEFGENEKYRLVRRKDSVKIFHSILSFSNKDSQHITDKLLRDVAKKFVNERGANNLFVGTKHEDRDHIHLHIAVSGTQLNGRSSRMSKQQLHHVKLELDKYQRDKYPKLIHSLPDHGRAKREKTKEAILEVIKKSRETDKASLCTILEEAYNKSSTVEQFLSIISVVGHPPYYRNGRLQGILYEGQTKFRLKQLGYDELTLQGLDKVKVKEQAELQEFENLRKGKTREMLKEDHPLPVETVDKTDSQEQEMLDEMDVLRGGREDEERSIIIDESAEGEEDPHDNSTSEETIVQEENTWRRSREMEPLPYEYDSDL